MTHDRSHHTPVLLAETVRLLAVRAGGAYVDGTVGGAGHAQAFLKASAPDGSLLALDRDPAAVAYARERLAPFGERAVVRHGSYVEMATIAAHVGLAAADGILLDLGLSSRQLDDGNRGFSFMTDGPLDMRFDQSQGPTAADLLNELPQAELAQLLWKYGELRHSRRLAAAVVRHRPLRSTTQLATLVAEESPRQRARTHPATRVFQALRIAVNGELEAVDAGIEAGLRFLRRGGRLAIISFHSLEDRMVKRRFRQASRACTCPPEQPICTCDQVQEFRLVTRKAVKPGPDELSANPRSRSARLRVIERMPVVAE